MDVGPAELIIVLLIVLLIFGSAKLPKLARSMGQAAHEFRKGLHLGSDDNDKSEAEHGATAGERDAPSATGDA